MQLVCVNEDNVVIEVLKGNMPLRVRLDNHFCVAPNDVELGWVLDIETERFGPPARKRWITNLAFDNRFTLDERVNIELAATLDPSMDVAQKRAAMSVRVELDRAKKAEYIDLTREDTRLGVEKFEAFELIGVGRAAEILDGPIAEHEYHSKA